MNDVMTFKNDLFDEVRVLCIEGEPWFVASDVCKSLGLCDTHVALRRVDSDEKGRHLIPTLGGNQPTSIVNEQGLYSLALGSRVPQAKAFKRWITHEVIPAIRRTGSYSIKQENLPAICEPRSMEVKPNAEQQAMLINAQIRQYETIIESMKNPQHFAIAVKVFGIEVGQAVS